MNNNCKRKKCSGSVPVHIISELAAIVILLHVLLLPGCRTKPSNDSDALLSDFFTNSDAQAGVEDFITNDVLQLHKVSHKGTRKEIEKIFKRTSTERIVDWALITIIVGNIEKVEEVLSIAIESNRHGALYFQQGICRLLLEHNEKALDSFEKAVSVNPPFKEAWPSLIAACLKLNKTEQAMALAAKALKQYSEDPVTIKNIVLLYLYTGQKEEALGLLQEKAELFKGVEYLELKNQIDRGLPPDKNDQRFTEHADIGVIIGSNYFDLGQYTAAELVFKRVLLLDPYHLAGAAELGLTFSQEGKNEEAIKFYNEKIGSYPDFELLRFNLGNLYSKLERYDEAAKQYEKCLELNEQWVDAISNLISVYILSGNHDKADLYIGKLKELNVPTETWELLNEEY